MTTSALVFALTLAACQPEGGRAPQCAHAQDLDVATPDGASIHLHRHAAQGPPVVVVHGISSNHHCWDLAPDRSLAVALQEAGFDAWLVDLRGHGDARRDAGGRHQWSGWTIDDYGRQDVLTAIEHVKAATGYARVGYVGHSLGGMVLATYQAWHGDASLAAAVVVGSPLDFSQPDPLLLLGRRSMAIGTAFPIVHTPSFAAAGSLAADHLPLHADELLYQPLNMDRRWRGPMLRRVASPLSRDELRHLASVVDSGRFQSADGAVDYVERLEELSTPLLVIAGRGDRIAPADRVRPFYEAAGSDEKQYVLAGRANGFGADYGHLDLAVGDRAAAEIYPLIVGWMGGRY